MKITYQNIINIHSGKTAICVGLGPALNKNLDWIQSLDKDKYIILSCNLYADILDLDVDYWLISNNLPTMQLPVLEDKFKAFSGTFLYNNEIDKSDPDYIPGHINYIKMANSDLSEITKLYCNADIKPYGAVHSVIVHLTALSIIMGCKEVLIAGVNLDYTHGYAKKGYSYDSLKLAEKIMPAHAPDVIEDIKQLKAIASKIGTTVLCLDQGTTLSGQIGVKEIEQNTNNESEDTNG